MGWERPIRSYFRLVPQYRLGGNNCLHDEISGRWPGRWLSGLKGNSFSVSEECIGDYALTGHGKSPKAVLNRGRLSDAPPISICDAPPFAQDEIL